MLERDLESALLKELLAGEDEPGEAAAVHSAWFGPQGLRRQMTQLRRLCAALRGERQAEQDLGFEG